MKTSEKTGSLKRTQKDCSLSFKLKVVEQLERIPDQNLSQVSIMLFNEIPR